MRLSALIMLTALMTGTGCERSTPTAPATPAASQPAKGSTFRAEIRIVLDRVRLAEAGISVDQVHARTSPMTDGDNPFSLDELRGLTIEGAAKTVRLDEVAKVEVVFTRPTGE